MITKKTGISNFLSIFLLKTLEENNHSFLSYLDMQDLVLIAYHSGSQPEGSLSNALHLSIYILQSRKPENEFKQSLLGFLNNIQKTRWKQKMTFNWNLSCFVSTLHDNGKVMMTTMMIIS